MWLEEFVVEPMAESFSKDFLPGIYRKIVALPKLTRTSTSSI